jgi:hypothetical protein
VAARADRQKGPVDPNIAVFISARLERRMDNELAALAGTGTPDAVCLAQLRALAQLQNRYRLPPLPTLAAWIAGQAGPLLATWRNRDRRAAVTERLKVLADTGYLAPMLAAVDDPAARGADAQEAQHAASQLSRIDMELAQIANGASARAAAASRLGQEIAAGFGLTALATVLAVAALG